MHGTTVENGNIQLNVLMYTALALEDIFNAYDSTIAGKASTSSLSSYQPLISAGTSGQYYRGDKTWQTLATVGTTGSYNDLSNKPSLATVATSGSYNDLTNKPIIPGTPTVNNNVSRTLNSNYTISGNTRGAQVSYSINAVWTLQALLSGSGAAFLEYTVNGTDWITVNNVGKGLNLLTFAGSDDMNLSGFIPATAANVRIRTTSTNMTVTYTRGQEVLF